MCLRSIIRGEDTAGTIASRAGGIITSMEGLIIAKPAGERRGAKLSSECVPRENSSSLSTYPSITDPLGRAACSQYDKKLCLRAFRTRRGAASCSPRPGASPLTSPAAGAGASKLARARSRSLGQTGVSTASPTASRRSHPHPNRHSNRPPIPHHNRRRNRHPNPHHTTPHRNPRPKPLRPRPGPILRNCRRPATG